MTGPRRPLERVEHAEDLFTARPNAAPAAADGSPWGDEGARPHMATPGHPAPAARTPSAARPDIDLGAALAPQRPTDVELEVSAHGAGRTTASARRLAAPSVPAAVSIGALLVAIVAAAVWGRAALAGAPLLALTWTLLALNRKQGPRR